LADYEFSLASSTPPCVIATSTSRCQGIIDAGRPDQDSW